MLRGADVTLVTGPTKLPVPPYLTCIPVTTAREMFEAVTSVSASQDIIIKAAAVADYRPTETAQEKVKKSDDALSLSLSRTDDILHYLGRHKPDGQFLCGFSMETEHLLENARTKLERKNLDLIVANNLNVTGAGFGVNTNVVTLIARGSQTQLPLMSKDEVAKRLTDTILTMRK